MVDRSCNLSFFIFAFNEANACGSHFSSYSCYIVTIYEKMMKSLSSNLSLVTINSSYKMYEIKQIGSI